MLNDVRHLGIMQWRNPLMTHFLFQLFSHLPKQKTQVVVLGTSAVSNYKSEKAPEDIQPPLLRALKTSEYHGSVACPYLEQPNVITGLPAQGLQSTLICLQFSNAKYVCQILLELSRGFTLSLSFQSLHTAKCITWRLWRTSVSWNQWCSLIWIRYGSSKLH